MKDMEQTEHASHQETWCLEGTYTEKDLRTFAAFLAKRVAGSKIWALGVFVLMPLVWSGKMRTSWQLMFPLAVVLIGFIFLMRFVILPNKLYRAAIKLPGVFEPRRITMDDQQVSNTSASGGHTFRLENIQEVIETPDHLFVMVAPKQGIPIPKTWMGGEGRVKDVIARLMSRRIPAK
jgi:hypothetical protein